MTKVLLSIGECMVEMAPRADGAYAMGFAGDTFNTAWYARAVLGDAWQVNYLSAVGDDAVSARMLDFMAGAGIGTAHVAALSGRTVGLYLIQLQGAERSFAYWRSASAARHLADDPARLAVALSGVQVAYLSGITLAILDEAGRKRLGDALAQARKAGTVVVFDPNLRPRLWETAAQMCDVVTMAAGWADVVLPSFDDEARFFGDRTTQETARRYAAGGAGVVVVKDGPNDVLAWQHGSVTTCSPPPVAQIVDTTAAGDSFNAGFLAAWLAGRDLAASAAAGAALAGRVIGARGALVRV